MLLDEDPAEVSCVHGNTIGLTADALQAHTSHVSSLQHTAGQDCNRENTRITVEPAASSPIAHW